MAINNTNYELAKELVAAGFKSDPAFPNIFVGKGKIFWTDGTFYRERTYPTIWFKFQPGQKIKLL